MKVSKQEAITMEGVRAFRTGEPDSTCPYKSAKDELNGAQRRIWWMDGYWAAHVVENVSCVTLEEMLGDLS